MRKVLLVARREFVATALTKGFIIGALIVPAMLAVAIPVMVMLIEGAEPPPVDGTLGVIDRTGLVADGIARELAPEAVQERQEAQAEEIRERIDEQLGELAPDTQALAQVMPDAPDITVENLGAGADVERAQKSLAQEGGRLALVVIEEGAVNPAAGEEGYAGYTLLTRPRLHDLIIDNIRDAIRTAIFEARARASGLDPDQVRALTHIGGEQKEVTETGEVRESTQVLNIMLPFAFLILVMISVMISGQYLLTTTVEEKSSRVVEILLSALTPMQLMAGKIVGQMLVGMSLMVIYGSLGLSAMIAFAVADLLSITTILWLLVFYVLAYFLIASFMAAIGSAVNEMREAQAMMTPVIIVTIAPYMLAMPISRDPNSTLATVLSLVPPFAPFIMIVRVASSQPPPVWQIVLSAVISAASVYAAVWLCAKIFRIGLLMFGKPPNFRTLVRWVRMA